MSLLAYEFLVLSIILLGVLAYLLLLVVGLLLLISLFLAWRRYQRILTETWSEQEKVIAGDDFYVYVDVTEQQGWTFVPPQKRHVNQIGRI